MNLVDRPRNDTQTDMQAWWSDLPAGVGKCIFAVGHLWKLPLDLSTRTVRMGVSGNNGESPARMKNLPFLIKSSTTSFISSFSL